MAPLSAAHRAAIPLSAATCRAATASSTPTPTPTQILSAAAHRTATPLLLSAPAPLLRRAGILGSRAVSPPANLRHAATKSSAFSSCIIGNRSSVSAPTHLAAGGYLIAQRGIAGQPEALSPELKKELQRMKEASVARHHEIAKRLSDFQATVKMEYAVLEVARADSAEQNARVGWRIIWGSLATAALGIWYLLHTKSMWMRDFKISALMLLTELLVKLQADLEEELKAIVREEVTKKEE